MVDLRAVDAPLAPELVDITSDSIGESKPADIFAFAMLAFELFAERPPFDGQSPATVALLISQNTRPEFPADTEDTGLTTQMRDFLQRCWHPDPKERPTIDLVVKTFECAPRPPDQCAKVLPTTPSKHQSIAPNITFL